MKELVLPGKTWSLPEMKDRTFLELETGLFVLAARPETGAKAPRSHDATRLPDAAWRRDPMVSLKKHCGELSGGLSSRLELWKIAFGEAREWLRESFAERLHAIELRSSGGAGKRAGVSAEIAHLVFEPIKACLLQAEALHRGQELLGALDATLGELAGLSRAFEPLAGIPRDAQERLAILLDRIASLDVSLSLCLDGMRTVTERIDAGLGIASGKELPDGVLLAALCRSRLRPALLDALASAMDDGDFRGHTFDLDQDLATTIDFAALADNIDGLLSRCPGSLGPKRDLPPTFLSRRNEGADIPAPLPWARAAAEAGLAARAAFTAAPAQDSAASQSARSAYRSAISRINPTLIVFLLDRSASMEGLFAAGLTKADYLARTVDSCLLELATRCAKADGTRDYFHVSCLGYGDGLVESAFAPPLSVDDWAPISLIGARPRHIRETEDGVREPSWIEAEANGSTPMCEAFETACGFVADWCDAHPASYPPTVINISDGEATDGDPRRQAGILRSLRTRDGDVLLFNLHLSSGAGAERVFPSNPEGLDEGGRRLFEMSSPFPPHILDRAKAIGFDVGVASRFFAFGAGAELATRFLELGTRTGRLA